MSAPPPGKGRVDGPSSFDQYGSNLRKDTLPFSFPALEGHGGGKVLLGAEGDEAGLPGLEGSSVSTVSDPLPSWSVDSPSSQGPPAKLARLELVSEPQPKGKELVGEAQGMEVEGELVMSDVETGGGQRLQGPVLQDLQKEAQVGTPMARGPRSMAIPYVRKATPATTSVVRKSARNTGGASAVSILERAQLLTADKNLENAKENAKVAEKGTDFSVLDLFPDSHLSSVVKESCVIFSPTVGSPGEALSIIRAKEKVQAALAATARRLKLEAEARKAAGASASPMPREGLGNPDECATVPGGELTRTEEKTGPVPSGEEGDMAERDGREDAAGIADNSRRKAPKKRRKKSSLTVRKGASKRKGHQ
jgi:hypothetical protein